MTAFVVEDSPTGTSEAVWLGHPDVQRCRSLDLSTGRRVVVLAPHPDDEVLGVGGLLATLRCPTEIVAITDGEMCHPGRTDIASIRCRERDQALSKLGVDARVIRLGIPDGQVEHADDLVSRLLPIVATASLVLAPWPQDGHPDHDATGAAARDVSAALTRRGHRIQIAYYPIWAWHWATPSELPWSRARRHELSPAVARAKHQAIEAYASQLQPYRGVTVLPPHVVQRFTRPFEVVFV